MTMLRCRERAAVTDLQPATHDPIDRTYIMKSGLAAQNTADGIFGTDSIKLQSGPSFRPGDHRAAWANRHV